jgi:hypothetical protein
MIVTNLTSDIHFYLVGPAIPLAPGESREVLDVHRQDYDIDALINKGYLETTNYSKYGASVVVQPELNGLVHPPAGTDDITNDSIVPGTTATDALEWLYAATTKKYKHTLTATDITLKYFYLPEPPSNLLRVIMRVRGAPDQTVNDDFQAVFDGRIRWQGYPLDGVLSAGDIVEVIYT